MDTRTELMDTISSTGMIVIAFLGGKYTNQASSSTVI